jgi:two-component system response regulator GlrR
MKTYWQMREQFEREYLINLLRQTQGNISQAASLAGVQRPYFYRVIRRLEIDPISFRISVSTTVSLDP